MISYSFSLRRFLLIRTILQMSQHQIRLDRQRNMRRFSFVQRYCSSPVCWRV